jgi:vacuolar-type H+-ATPase subunit E/Vma4
VGTGLESYIKRHARERAMNRIAEAEAEAAQIKQRADQAVRLVNQETQHNTRAKIASNHRRVMAQAELESKSLRLARREALLRQIWERTQHRLETEIEPQVRRASIKALLIDAARQLGGGRLVVQVSQCDALVLAQGVLEHIEQELASEGLLVQLEMVESGDAMLGGVIVRSPDGRHLVDNSWDARLNRASTELRDQVHHRLSAGATKE